MRRTSTTLARFARRLLIALWSLLLVAASVVLIELPDAGRADACDTSCMECDAEKSGHHCPPGCPECHAHQGPIASLPSAPLGSLEEFPFRVDDVSLTPIEAATPVQHFFPSIYRPPRSQAHSS